MTDDTAESESAALRAWRDGLADIAFSGAFMDADGSTECVVDLARQIADHPQRLLPDMVAQVEALVAANAQASAALALVEPLACFMLSGAPGGRYLATVVPLGQVDEHHAEGASAALALCGALATALAGGSEDRRANVVSDDDHNVYRLN